MIEIQEDLHFKMMEVWENNENSSYDDNETLTLLEENSNFTLSVHIIGPLLGTIILLETITGLVANLFVLIVTQWDAKSRLNPSTIFLNNLLFADLIAFVTAYPFMVITDFTGYWIFGSNVLEKHSFCQFVGYMFWFATMLVTFTLAVISCDRWLFIVKPLIYKRFMKLPTALVIVIGLWIVCAALNTTPFYGLGSFRFSPRVGLCVPIWEDQRNYLIYMVTLFVILVAIIMTTSIWTCCFTRSFLARSEATTQDHQLYASKKRRVCGIFSTLVIVCAICFIPSIITAIILIFVDVPDQIYAASFALSSLIFTANPFIQSYFRPDVKRVLTSVWNHLIVSPKSIETSDNHKNNTMYTVQTIDSINVV